MSQSLADVARAMVAPGKGILAADESSGTIKKRFDAIKTESTADSRRDYREMLFRSTEAMKNHISGVILYDETIRQNAKDGTPLAKIIAASGALPGIKVDAGTKPLPYCPGEVITEGLDGLAGRIKEYVGLGAKFTKWRAVIDIGKNMPSYNCINANAQALARYAALCVEGGLVPIVEPEVLMEGAHDLERCAEVTGSVLHAVFNALHQQGVLLEGMLLKPNMVVPGQESPKPASVQEVANATLRCLRRHVSTAVPGIVFLSGGQEASQATIHLDAINRLPGAKPWAISFSYGRALQDPALAAWRGRNDNLAAGAEALSRRARCNSAASLGSYTDGMEKAPVGSVESQVQREMQDD